MRKTVISLVGLNLLLAGYLAAVLMRQTSRRVQAIPDALPAPSVASAASRVSSPQPPPATQTETSSVNAAVTWSAFASHDLRKYAANLRRVGCPEETIKDIMQAEVNRLYGPRERTLKVRPADISPWERAGVYDRHSGEAQLRQFLEEKRALLKDLAGIDVPIDMPSRLAGRSVEKFELAFGALPQAKQDQVRSIQEKYWAQSDDLKQRTMGYLEPEDREEFVRIKTERRDALAQALTPRELQDYEIKTSDTTPALRSRLEGFDLSDDEFRKIFEFMQPLDDQYSLSRRNPDPENAQFTASRSQAEKDLQNHIRTVLGEERYADYQRSRDPAYKNINQIGSQAGLPKEAIIQAYQTQHHMQDESRRILRDSTLTPEQRAQSINAMRVQAQQTMQQRFGDQAVQLIQQFPDVRMSERYGGALRPVQVVPNLGGNILIPHP